MPRAKNSPPSVPETQAPTGWSQTQLLPQVEFTEIMQIHALDGVQQGSDWVGGGGGVGGFGVRGVLSLAGCAAFTVTDSRDASDS